jgi:hypothetical protein
MPAKLLSSVPVPTSLGCISGRVEYRIWLSGFMEEST